MFSFQRGILGDVGQIRRLCIFWQILGYPPSWLLGRMSESRANGQFELLKLCKIAPKTLKQTALVSRNRQAGAGQKVCA